MKKVVVIGAGPAGLTAAYELLKSSKEYDVVILEETGDIGGISKTVKYNFSTGYHLLSSVSKMSLMSS
jgi:protoporphyrinogen oxidase